LIFALFTPVVPGVFGATLTNIIELAKLQENTIFDWKKKNS